MTHQLIIKWETSYLDKNSNSPTSINWQFFKHPFSRKSATICLCFHRLSQTCCCSGQRSGCWHHGDDSRPVWRCLCDGRRHIRHTIQQARTVAGGMFDLHVLQVRKPFRASLQWMIQTSTYWENFQSEFMLGWLT